MKNMVKFSVGYFLLTILIAGCGPVATQPSTAEKTIAVRTAKVTRQEKSTGLHYSGTIEASRTVPLTFQATGTIEKIYVETGDAVKKGQLLASLDNTDMKNIYDAAVSRYEQAKDAWDRLKTVHEKGSLPEIKWVEMETNLEQAKSTMEIAKNNLEKCNMRAPVTGLVGRRNIEPGQSAIGSALSPIELVQIETVLVKISAPENEIGRITKGQNAGFSVAALNGRYFEGTVTNISPVADLLSRTYPVKIQVNNPGLELKPGMVCDVTLSPDTVEGNLVIPYRAVSKDDDGKAFVFKVTDDGRQVVKQQITTGSYGEAGIEVLGGLALNQEIVVEGMEKLSDNSLISR